MRTSVVVAAAALLASAPSLAAGEACPSAPFLVAAGVDVDDECSSLRFAPGGWLEREQADGSLFCANRGASEIAAPASATTSALEEAGLVCHLAAAPPSSGPPPSSLPVFVLDFQSVDEETRTAAEVLGRLVTVEAGRLDGVSVMSGAEVRSLLAAEAKRQAQGCDEGASCFAEIAGALGARYVIAGEVTAVGRAQQLDVSLLDTESARVVASESVMARDVVDMAALVDDVTHNLFVTVRGGEPRPLPAPRLGRAMEDPDAIAGALVTAGSTLLGAGLFSLLPMLPTIGCGLALCASGTFGIFTVMFFTPTLLLLPCTTCLAGGAGSCAADWWHDAEMNPWRAVLAAASASACSGGVLAGGVGTLVFATPLIRIAFGDDARQPLGITGLVAVAGVAALAGAVASLLAYEAGIGVFGDEGARAADVELKDDEDREGALQRPNRSLAQAY